MLKHFTKRKTFDCICNVKKKQRGIVQKVVYIPATLSENIVS